MSGLAVAALALVCAWLGILTLVVVLLVRQMGLLTVRFSVATEGLSVDNDGPAIGSVVPEAVTTSLPETDEQAYVLLVSANCNPCRELVADLTGRRLDQRVVALVPGDEERADELMRLLPPDVRAVPDPEATALAGALDLQSTPFVLEIENARVIDKAYLHDGAAGLLEFIGEEDHRSPDEMTTPVDIKSKEKI